MKILTIYYSLTGNNKKLVNYLQEKTNCETFEIKTKKKVGFGSIFCGLVFKTKPKLAPYSVDFKQYDKVIFISPIWFGKLSYPLKSFLIKEKLNIPDYSFLSICLGGQKDKIESELKSIVNKKPFYIEEFGLKKFIENGSLKMGDKLDEESFEKLKKEIDNTLKIMFSDND